MTGLSTAKNSTFSNLPDYLFPNDQTEIERLDDQHEIFRIVQGGRNFLAPWTEASPPKKVLDVATGTGRWAVEVGDEFPGTDVIGVDLSPIQPTLVPPNVAFFVEDASEGDWTGEDFDGIDYIHTRLTTGCWDSFQDTVVEKGYRALQPGGWLECQEMDEYWYSDDGSLAPDAPLVLWGKDLVEVGERSKRSLTAAKSLRGWFEAAGFVDIQEKVYKLPVNGWARDPRLKKVGDMWQRNLQSGLQAFTYAYMHRVLGKTKEEIEVFLVNVRKDIANPSVHAYNLYYVVCGRKPTVEEMEVSSGAASVKTTRSSTSGSTLTSTPTI